MKHLFTSILLLISFFSYAQTPSGGVHKAGDFSWGDPCGEHATYIVYEFYDMAIYGYGDMYDFESVSDQPWVDYAEMIPSVTITENITSIGAHAFQCFKSLEAIDIPKNIARIGELALVQCPNVKTIKVDSENTVYDSRNDCNAVIETATDILIVGCQNTVIPEGVKTIGKGAFADCYELTWITLPESLTTIEDYAFKGCRNLPAISLHEGIKTIGEHAFDMCTNLTGITIPSSVQTIGKSAFQNCKNLVVVKLPNTLAIIPMCCFAQCSSLTSVNIPKGVKFIEKYAFEECTNLTTVTIPKSVTSIGLDAFSDCLLQTINYTGSETEWNAIEGISELELPDDVTINFNYYRHDPSSHQVVAYPEHTNTCVEAGNTLYYHCEDCERYFADYACEILLENQSWILPATGNHTPSEPVVENRIEPTETQSGSYELATYCTECHTELSRTTTELPATTIPSILNAPQVAAIYTLSGTRISTPRPGINILRLTDGTPHKIHLK